MKIGINRVVVNSFLILVAAGFLWYIVQSQNILQEKPKSSTLKPTSVEILFTDKNYSLDYQKFDPQLVENIGLFTSAEKWVGSGFYDKDIYFEYPSSLYLAGGNRSVITDVRDVFLNLSKILSFDLTVNLQSSTTDLEIANLNFVDTNGRSARYVLPPLNGGWQVVTIPKEQFTLDAGFNWTKIAKVQFDFLPRSAGKVVVRLGSLRGQPGSILYNDWNVVNPNMLLLDKRNDVISLLARNIGSSVATIKKITWAQNFTFKSTYIPLSVGNAGLFFRGNYQTGLGYYLLMGGLNSNKWVLYKNGKDGIKVLVTGEINNFQFNPHEKYYLKSETKGNNIKAYFSTDNVNYTLLADVVDDEFLSGGVGVAVENGVIALFNGFEFKQ